jgi:hypothetical protein
MNHSRLNRVGSAKPVQFLFERANVTPSDLLSLCGIVLGALALWVAWLAYRATATIWIEVLAVESGHKTSPKHPRGYHFLTITIRNRGIPIDAVKAWLRTGNQFVTHRLALQRVLYESREEIIHGDAGFGPGMVGCFQLSSVVYPDIADDFKHFKSAFQSDATLEFQSHGYLVHKHRLWQRFYWFRSEWNILASRINAWFDSTVSTSRGQFLRTGKVVPTFNIDSHFRIDQFAEDVQRAPRPAAASPLVDDPFGIGAQ